MLARSVRDSSSAAVECFVTLPAVSVSIGCAGSALTIAAQGPRKSAARSWARVRCSWMGLRCVTLHSSSGCGLRARRRRLVRRDATGGVAPTAPAHSAYGRADPPLCPLLLAVEAQGLHHRRVAEAE